MENMNDICLKASSYSSNFRQLGRLLNSNSLVFASQPCSMMAIGRNMTYGFGLLLYNSGWHHCHHSAGFGSGEMFAVALSVVVLLFGGANSFDDNNLYGISHTTIVTKNIELSRKYYDLVLGGMRIEGLSTGDEGVFGDSHYYRIFQDEILEAQSTGRSLDDVGVPDISDNGNYVVSRIIVHLFQVIG